MMIDTQSVIFQCVNPQCGLRFPVAGNLPRWNRCPICRSNLNIVSVTTKSTIEDSPQKRKFKIPVEGFLDNLRSAFNVGSIYRTADGTGIRKIYHCGISPNPENPKVRKTALGAENNIQWEYSRNGLLTALNLKAKGYYLWSLEDLRSAEPLFDIKIPPINSTVILIVGNEVSGVDPGILDICDRVISIPMLGTKQSYNVAIAFSIAASFLLFRYRNISSD